MNERIYIANDKVQNIYIMYIYKPKYMLYNIFIIQTSPIFNYFSRKSNFSKPPKII